MSTVDCSVGVIALFQKDLDQAQEFCAQVFDKAPDFAEASSANCHVDTAIINLQAARKS